MRQSFHKSIAFFLKFSVFSALLIFIALYTGGKIMERQDAAMLAAYPVDEPQKIVTVVIDAGHGGRDGGASTDDDGTLEKDLNLAVAKKLSALMKTAGVNVVMTRNDDIELADPASSHKKLDDLNARIAIANEKEDSIFVSIHMNKFPVAKYSGLQVYYSGNDEGSQTLAGIIQGAAASFLNENNARKTKSAGDSIYILHHLRIPAVLVECGFLSNYEEKEMLKTDEYQTKLAMTLYAAILDYIDTEYS